MYRVIELKFKISIQNIPVVVDGNLVRDKLKIKSY